jgi:hypothetical protein
MVILWTNDGKSLIPASGLCEAGYIGPGEKNS